MERKSCVFMIREEEKVSSVSVMFVVNKQIITVKIKWFLSAPLSVNID